MTRWENSVATAAAPGFDPSIEVIVDIDGIQALSWFIVDYYVYLFTLRVRNFFSESSWRGDFKTALIYK